MTSQNIDLADGAAEAAGVPDWEATALAAWGTEGGDAAEGGADAGATEEQATELEGDAETEATEDDEAEPPEGEAPAEDALDVQATAAVAAFQHIDKVWTAEDRNAAFAAVPEPLKPIVAGVINNLHSQVTQAQTVGYERGMEDGERFAVLQELYAEDREAFEEKIAENPTEAAAFFERKRKLAEKAGLNNPEAQAVLQEAASILEDLQEHPAWLAHVTQQAQGLKATPADLKKLQRLVDRALIRIEDGVTSPNASAPQAAAPRSSRAQQAAAAAARLRDLPKPDAGGGTGGGGRSILANTNLRESGAGANLAERALAGEFRNAD